MRTIVVEEWVHIPEGGTLTHLVFITFYSYIDSEDKKSEGKGSQRRDHQGLQTHARRDENHEASN